MKNHVAVYGCDICYCFGSASWNAQLYVSFFLRSIQKKEKVNINFTGYSENLPCI